MLFLVRSCISEPISDRATAVGRRGSDLLSLKKTQHCKDRNFIDLTMIAIIATSDLRPHNVSYNRKEKRYIFDSYICYIQVGKKSLKIPCDAIRNTAGLRKMLYCKLVLHFNQVILRLTKINCSED